MRLVIAARVVVPRTAALALCSGDKEKSNSLRSILNPCRRRVRLVASNSRCALLGPIETMPTKIAARKTSAAAIFQRSFICERILLVNECWSLVQLLQSALSLLFESVVG